MSDEKLFYEGVAKSPVIAILRHLSPTKAIAVGEARISSGVSVIEVPLNGRDAFESLEILAKSLSQYALIGAGTVLTAQEVGRAVGCGARFILSPNMDAEVVGATRCLGLASIPGVATPSEALAALKYGATALKIFPGGLFPPDIIKSLCTVLPSETLLIMSGGINTTNIRNYYDAGIRGFGVTSAIFSSDMTPEEVGLKARYLMAALEGVTK